MRFSVFINFMFFLVLLMLIQPVQAKAYNELVDDSAVCINATQKMEKVYQIKRHLLTTIASVETGRWNAEKKQKNAWPWTVNAQGKGTFFETKAEAIREVKKLQAQGVKSIDVGCMQINLAYHPDAFDSIEKAFDPQTNAEYAAKFLKNLYENNNKDWIKAAMAYHSSVPTKALKYKKKIVSAYEVVKQAQNNLDKTLFGEQNNENAVKVAVIAPKFAEKAKPNKVVRESKNNANQWREAKLAEWRMRNN